MKVKYVSVAITIFAVLFFVTCQANAQLIYDLRVVSSTTGTISSNQKTLSLNPNVSGSNSATLQLWGVINDGGAPGFSDDILFRGALNIYANNKIGNGAITATSGVTAAAFPVNANFDVNS